MGTKFVHIICEERLLSYFWNRAIYNNIPYRFFLLQILPHCFKTVSLSPSNMAFTRVFPRAQGQERLLLPGPTVRSICIPCVCFSLRLAYYYFPYTCMCIREEWPKRGRSAFFVRYGICRLRIKRPSCIQLWCVQFVRLCRHHLRNRKCHFCHAWFARRANIVPFTAFGPLSFPFLNGRDYKSGLIVWPGQEAARYRQ